MNICIFSTYDNFFLKRLILSIIKKNKDHNFCFYFVNDYKSLNNILVKATSIGFFKSIFFITQSLIIKFLKKDLISSLDNKIILKEKSNREDITKFIIDNKIDLIISINYPKIIPKKILKLCKFGGINHHLGKLPKYKGRYPVANAILNGDKNIFITVHTMTEKIDSGKIIFTKSVSIKKYKNNFINIYEILFKKSEKLLSSSIKYIMKYGSKNKVKFYKDKNSKNDYCKKLNFLQIMRIFLLRVL